MLRDHFHPPLVNRRNWKGFHNEWATYISADVNRQLPEGWYATTVVEFGVEIDVAALDDSLERSESAVAEGTHNWTPSEPHLTIALPIIADVVEVQVFRTSGGNTLAGAIELVSPRNKDRPEARDAFVAKCESLLAAGVGLVVVDIVTDLHGGLLERLQQGVPSSAESGLYAAAYHPIVRDDQPSLDVWHEPLSIGGQLATVPLFLHGGPCVPIELDRTYRRTCEEQRIPAPASPEA